MVVARSFLFVILLFAQSTARFRRSKRDGDVCTHPSDPENGHFDCLKDARGQYFVCTATCAPGYNFTTRDMSIVKRCNIYANFWEDDVLDLPSCLQTSEMDTCVPPQAPQHGAFRCTTNGTEKACTLECQDGFRLVPRVAVVYRCSQSGTWSPAVSDASGCVKVKVAEKDSTLSRIPRSAQLGSNVHPSITNAATCMAWGQDHYRTFDGRVYNFRGACEYLLARDCDFETFHVHVINDASCNTDLAAGTGSTTCTREVDIYLDTTTHIELRIANTSGDLLLRWNGEVLTVPTSRDGVVFEQVGSYLTVRSSLGFTIKWDGRQSVFVKVSDELKGRTCGLCGNFDENSDNDFENSDGQVVTSVASFANSWKRTALGADTCPDASQRTTCQTGSAQEQDLTHRSEARCALLLSDPAFVPCHAILDPADYLEACKWDCCSHDSSDCSCSTMEAYSRACMDLGVKLDWRRPDRCPITCNGGMEFQECGSVCTRQCGGTSAVCTDRTCIDGCFCPAGTLLNNGKCVAEDQCPCAHGDQDFHNGETVMQDCNTCTCTMGKWVCTNEKCPSTCSVVGDLHYLTFDGTWYNFMGMCSYYLFHSDDISIIIDNIQCGRRESSCMKSVTIEVGDDVIRMDQNHLLVLNEQEVKDLPLVSNGVKAYMVSSLFMEAELPNGMSILWDGRRRVYVTAPPSMVGKTSGLCGTFDGSQQNDFLTLDGDTEINVNAFGNRWKVDSTCRDVPLLPAPYPCDSNAQRTMQAQELCLKLKSDLFASCHSLVDVDAYYDNCVYDICACEANLQDCLCPSFGQYADTCASKGVMVEWRLQVTECMLKCAGGQEYQVCGNPCERTCRNIAEARSSTCSQRCVEGCNCPDGEALDANGECVPVSQCPCVFDGREFPPGYTTLMGSNLCVCSSAQWRCSVLQQGVPIPRNAQSLCPPTTRYTDCVSSCPTTCDSIENPTTCAPDSSHCQAGCACESGFVLDGSRCLNVSMCPCHHGGQSFYEGDVISMDCNKCTCRNRRWQCESNDCAGVCTAIGDSHYTTFDGRDFQFQGMCDYVLARSRDGSATPFLVSTENIACGTSGVTCSKMVEISVGEPGTSSFYSLRLIRGQPVTASDPGSPFTVETVGQFLRVSTTFGLSLQWDHGTRLYLTLASQHRGQVEGLCGNFNGDQKDDFTTPQGGPPAIKATTFGDSWRMHSYCGLSAEVTDTCAVAPHRKPWAQRKCGVLASDLFSPCHTIEPYEKYFDRCVYDSCACDLGGDCECLCTAIAAYAHVCATKGALIKWRSSDLCPIECEDCQTYNPCVTTCPKKTCLNRLQYSSLLATCQGTSSMCAEGCDLQPCPPGQVYDSLQSPVTCIPEPLCDSTACEINGKLYREGERVYDYPMCNDQCEICNCRNGSIEHISFGYCTRITVTSVSSTTTDETSRTTSSATTPITPITSSIYTFSSTSSMSSTLTPTATSSAGTPTTPQETSPLSSSQTSFSSGISSTATVTSLSSSSPPSGTSTPIATPSLTPSITPKIPLFPTTSSLLVSSESPDTPSVTSSATTVVSQSSTVTSASSTATSSTSFTSPLSSSISSSQMSSTSDVTSSDSHSSSTGSSSLFSTSISVSPPATSHSSPSSSSPTPSSAVPSTTRSVWTTESSSVTAVTSSTVSPRCTDGWTSWMSVSVPTHVNVGDVETVPLLRTRYAFCQDLQIESIQCRAVGDSTNAASGQKFTCSLPDGLVCHHVDQKEGLCLDYEVRFSCNCELVTTTPTAETSTSSSYHPPTDSNPTTSEVTQSTLTISSLSTGSTNLDTQGSSVPMPSSSETQTLIISVPGRTVNVNVTTPRYPELNSTSTQSTLAPPSLPTDFPTPVTQSTVSPTTITMKFPTKSIKTPTYAPTTLKMENRRCESPSWSSWFNVDSPDGEGDFETILEIQKLHAVCDSHAMTYIQCRTAVTHVRYDMTKDSGVVCSNKTGLSCHNSQQANGAQCEDYEVQVYCDCKYTNCGEPLVRMAAENNILKMSASSEKDYTHTAEHGRLESLTNWSPARDDLHPWLQVDFGYPLKVTGVSTKGNPVAPEWTVLYTLEVSHDCKTFQPLLDPTGIPEIFEGNTDSNTTVTHMFRQNEESVQCVKILPVHANLFYALRLEVLGCSEKIGTLPDTVSTQTPTPATISKHTISTTGEVQTSSPSATPTASPTPTPETPSRPTVSQETLSETVSTPTPTPGTTSINTIFTTGKVQTSSPSATPTASPTPTPETPSRPTVSQETLSETVSTPAPTPRTTSKHTISTSGEVQTSSPQATPTASPTPTPETPSRPTVSQGLSTTEPSSVTTPILYTCSDGWTSWFGVDTPTVAHEYETQGDGDYELLSELRQRYSFCATPDAIRCRGVKSKTPSHLFASHVTCDLDKGLVCINAHEASGQCEDFEVSFNCDCTTETSTTMKTTVTSTISPPPTITSPPTPGTPWSPVPSCRWTSWMNSYPRTLSSTGDFETFSNLRMSYPFCEHPTGIECRVTFDASQVNLRGKSYKEAGQLGVTCDLNRGLTCLDISQASGDKCLDYEVRVLCLDGCPESTTPLDTGSSSEPSTRGPSTTGSEFTTPSDTTTNKVTTSNGTSTVQTPRSTGPQLTESSPATDLTSGTGSTISSRFSSTESSTTSVKVTSTVVTTTASQTSSVVVCSKYMGVHDPYVIPKDQMTASSVYNYTTEAFHGRLDNTGAWVPRIQDKDQWIQVDFKHVEPVTGVVMQGHPTFPYWVTSYTISTSIDGKTFTPYVESGQMSPTVFAGNSDPLAHVQAFFDREVPARYVRIHPLEWKTEIAIRFEVLGCHGLEPPTTVSSTFISESTPTSDTTHSSTLVTTGSVGSSGFTSQFTSGKTPSVTPTVSPGVTSESTSGSSTTSESTSGSSTTTHISPSLRIDINSTHSGQSTSVSSEQPTSSSSRKTTYPTSGQTTSSTSGQTTYPTSGQTTSPTSGQTTPPTSGQTTPLTSGQTTYPTSKQTTSPTSGQTTYPTSGQTTSPTSEQTTYSIKSSPPIPSPTTLTTETTTVACESGYQWSACAYSCDETCDYLARLSGACDGTASPGCVPGCRPVSLQPSAPACPAGQRLKDARTCVSTEVCPCMKPDGTPARAFESWTHPNDACSQCSCFNGAVRCINDDSCTILSTTTSTDQTSPTTPTVCGWSQWMNMDTPATGAADIESMARAATLYNTCPTPSAIECREVTTKVTAQATGQALVCSTATGLECHNVDNVGGCKDYEIRVYCLCTATEYTTTDENTTPTVPTTYTPPMCGWTQWMSSNTPDSFGEQETIPELRSHFDFCQIEDITAIECRSKVSHLPSSEQTGVICDTRFSGLICRQMALAPNETCADYEVRFLCEPTDLDWCRSTSTTDLTTKFSTSHVTSEPTSISETTTERRGSSSTLSTVTPTSQDLSTTKKSIEVSSTHLSVTTPGGEVSTTTLAIVTSRGSETTPKGTSPVSSISTTALHSSPGTGSTPTTTVELLSSTKRENYTKSTDGIQSVPTSSVTQSVPTSSVTEQSTPYFKCHEEMGVASGQIRDDMITASSRRDKTHDESKARLGGSGAWLPARDDKYQYIQVDFLEERYISGVTTQGRPDAPSYVTSFRVLYSVDGVNWNVYQESLTQEKIFVGNTDSNTPVTQNFRQPIRARYIRINPLSWSGRIALRFELYGCFEPYPTPTTTVPPVTTSLSTVTEVPTITVSKTPEACILWDDWVDTTHPTSPDFNDVETLEKIKTMSRFCHKPVEIQCRTAGPDHTPWDESGQQVRCFLWEGLTCLGSEQQEGICLNYEVRLGCISNTSKCTPKITPTAAPPLLPPKTSVVPCYQGLDVSACPADCPLGTYCDGLRCVARHKCPCDLQGQFVKAGDVAQSKSCETCQCLNGRLLCGTRTCPPCPEGVAMLNSSSCECQCVRCTDKEFQCSNGHCIPVSLWCDGIIDCVDDELNCLPTPSTPFITPTSESRSTATPTSGVTTSSAHTITTFDSTSSHASSGTPVTKDNTDKSTTATSTGFTTVVVTAGNVTTPINCDRVTCPPLMEPTLGPGYTTMRVRIATSCCDEYITMCQPSLCPAADVTCTSPLVLSQIPGEQCCPKYICVNTSTSTATSLAPPPITPVPTPPVCLYLHLDHYQAEISKPVVYSPGARWNDGDCKNCTCIYKPDSSVEVVCDNQNCSPCEIGETMVTKDGECCGHCKAVGCVVNGVVYSKGDVIASDRKCYEKTCTLDGSGDAFVVLEAQKECRPLSDLPLCKDDEQTSAYSSDGCCLTCIPKSSVTCSPQAMFTRLQDSVGFLKAVNPSGVECSNQVPLGDLTKCAGSCDSRAIYSDVMHSFKDTCSCCTPTKTFTRSVQLTCNDGSTLDHTYTVARACSCGACSMQ